MKVNFFLLFAFITIVQAEGVAQKVSLNLKNVRLEKAFKEISNQTNLKFLYPNSVIEHSGNVTVILKDATLSEALDQVLKNRNMSYTIIANTISVNLDKRKHDLEYTEDNYQQIKVVGTVRNSSGGLLAGATVAVKGTSLSTTTNERGEFEISTAPTATLVITYVGHSPREVQVNNRTTLVVVMQELASEIDNVEVVATGYQDLDRKFFTGASARLSAKDAERVGVPDISRMLEGQVSGVNIQNVSGTFGAAPKIRIRGATSISGDNKPLWVIDGIILEDVVNVSNEQLSTGDANTLIGSSVAGLNPDDIESFQILKDAAATAMYGARAMNGVIVVTTKKGGGIAGKPSFSYTSNLTSYLKPNYSTYNVMNSADQMELYLELREKGYVNPARTATASSTGVFGKMYNMFYEYDMHSKEYAMRNDPKDIENYLRAAALRNTDWFDILFKNSLMQEHSISMSAGSENSRVYASTSYLQDHGWTIADGVKRMTGNVRGDFKVSNKVDIGLLANASIRDQKSPGTLGRITNVVSGQYERDFDINPFNYALNTSRALAAYEDDGSFAFYTNNYTPFSILHELDNNSLSTTNLDFKMQGEFKWKILDNLKYSFDGAYRYVKTKQEHNVLETSNHAESYRMGTEYGIGGKNSVIAEKNRYLYTNPDDPTAHPISVLPYGGFHKISENDLNSFYLRNSLNYTHVIDLHSFDVLGLTELRSLNRQRSFFDGVGYQFDKGGVPYFDPIYFEYISKGNSTYYGMGKEFERYVAFMLRGAYSYDDRYNFNFTTRYDGSNLLGISRVGRWLPTWNVSGAWNIDQEEFFQSQHVLSQTRLRATYGLVASMGNATNSSVVYYNSITDRPNFNERENALVIDDLENSELTWEKQYEANVGLDLGFINNRMVVTADLYHRKAFDLIGLFLNAGIGGQSRKYANYADMNSKGVELTVQYRILDQENWKWNTRFNISHHTNKITKLQNLPRIWDVVRPEGGAKEGYPVRGLFSIQYDGLNPKNGLPLFVDENGNNGQTAVYLQSTNLNNLVFHGPVDPSTAGGFFNSVSYKQLSLSALFTFSAGNYVRLNPVFRSVYSDQDASSQDLLDRWVVIGDDLMTNVPSILGDGQAETYTGYPYNNYNYSDQRIASGDFIRLKQMMLTYQLPSALAKKAALRSASLSFVANNLWLLYSDKKLNGQDPEFYQSGGVALPVQRQFSLSLKVGL